MRYVPTNEVEICCWGQNTTRRDQRLEDGGGGGTSPEERAGREFGLKLHGKWAVYSKSPVINPTNQYICGSYSPKEEMDHDVTVKTLVDRAKREEAAVGVTLALACAPLHRAGNAEKRGSHQRLRTFAVT